MNNIISYKKIREFAENHADARESLNNWYRVIKQANWSTPNELRKAYPSADILQDNRVVFNIKGNHYRVIVRMNYESQTVFIRFIGTHSEYDKIDATTI